MVWIQHADTQEGSSGNEKGGCFRNALIAGESPALPSALVVWAGLPPSSVDSQTRAPSNPF